MTIKAPSATEDFGFFNGYVRKPLGLDLLKEFKENLENTELFFANIPTDKHLYSYDAGKWNIKEVMQHLVDAERTFGYRILRNSRQDSQPLPAIDPNPFVVNAGASARDMQDMLEEFRLLRMATIIMFANMTEEMLDLSGPARDAVVSVRAFGFAIIGHVMHHTSIVKERYL